MTSELGSRWTDAGALALVTIAIFAIVYCVNGGAAFPTDDAFINLHNAQVLRLGRDENDEGVPALVGATSGVHLALLWLLSNWCIPILPLCMCSARSVASPMCSAYSLRVPQHRMSSSGSGADCLRQPCLRGHVVQVLNGMDTGLAMAAVAWDIKLLTDKEAHLLASGSMRHHAVCSAGTQLPFGRLDAHRVLGKECC